LGGRAGRRLRRRQRTTSDQHDGRKAGGPDEPRRAKEGVQR
jgi:hypothetical protein